MKKETIGIWMREQHANRCGGRWGGGAGRACDVIAHACAVGAPSQNGSGAYRPAAPCLTPDGNCRQASEVDPGLAPSQARPARVRPAHLVRMRARAPHQTAGEVRTSLVRPPEPVAPLADHALHKHARVVRACFMPGFARYVHTLKVTSARFRRVFHAPRLVRDAFAGPRRSQTTTNHPFAN